MPEQNTPNQYLKNLDVHYISLVDAGANLKELVYKSANRSRDAGPAQSGSASSFSKQVQIAKTDDDKRLVYCVVYSPDEVDAHGDAMKAEEIEKAAHHFMAEGRTDQVDKQHDEEPDEGLIVESYIIGKSDENFPDDPAGSWAVVIKVLDDDTWDEIKKGQITGISMQGRCNVEPAGDEEPMKSLFKKFMGFFEQQMKERKTSKDFQGNLMQHQLNEANWALQDAINEVLTDDDMDTFAAQKVAILGVIDDFRDYVNELEEDTSKQYKPDMSKETKQKAEEAEQETNGEEPSEVEKAIDKSMEKHLNPVKEKMEDLEERLGEVEKAAPGSQTQKGQQEDDEEDVEKGYGGIPLFGSGPRK